MAISKIQHFFPVLLQAMVVGFLPVVGPVISLGHMCLLYSLYTFEYKWVNMGEWTVLLNPRVGGRVLPRMDFTGGL